MTTVLVAVLALAAGWTLCHRHHARSHAMAAEHVARPSNQRASLEDGVIRVALAAACCERWWTSVGAEHDHQCTRKDHHA
ncbi:hypothetical protein ACWZEH_12885 [Streptomyces sp. QTS137]